MSPVNGEEDHNGEQTDENEGEQVLLAEESASSVLDEFGDISHVLEHFARVLLVVISVLKAIKLEVVITSAAVSVLRDVNRKNFVHIVCTKQDGN